MVSWSKNSLWSKGLMDLMCGRQCVDLDQLASETPADLDLHFLRENRILNKLCRKWLNTVCEVINNGHRFR